MSLFGNTAANSDASKTTGFNFGGTAGEATSTKPLFGNPTATAPSTNAPSLFGNPATATPSTNPPSLFGNSSNAAPSTNPPSLFGNLGASSTASKPLFGLGNPSTAAPSANPPSLFGNLGTSTTTSTAATPPSIGFGATAQSSNAGLTGTSTSLKMNLGSSTPLFGNVTPSTTTSAAPASSGLTLGTPLSTQTSSAPTVGLGGTSVAPSTPVVGLGGITSASSTTSSAAAPSFGLGGTSTTASATAPSTTGLTLGTPLSSSTPKQTLTASTPLFGNNAAAASTTAQPSSTGSSLGGSTSTAAPTSSTSLFGTTSTATPASTGLTLGGSSTAASATTTVSTAALQTMSFADFNGILARLTDEFESLNQQFVEDVRFLNDFDKVLRDNHSKIAAANEELSEIENDTSKCANESECISAQLKDISNLVTTLEKQLKINDLDDTLGDISKNSDVKRQHIMQMYLATDAQMIQLEEDVEGLSQQVNAIAKVTGPDQSNSPETFDDIRQILGNQMDQLIYVDKQSEELNKRLNDIKVKF
jgi:predicted  nucleic acid-binding Zn-ribbon protein